ncbi:iron complex transport system substrate-binding protein [Paenibacillus sophorae]|uniref:ABC transporter substrate-binding protein n=1 Tax=Paenibacillus sophorae TaxID=1333845 RepID=A0A1H8RTN5_9BACL|nr:ABC transporter substrate-binding protein [Paenibacillus sophorae]QWU16971.1 ABC transporter substrate-binding protein [Paenibacillus sophorae]SEO70009.1 iron complex transport system substrate-binding protein [Paenibacillus sophorae]
MKNRRILLTLLLCTLLLMLPLYGCGNGTNTAANNAQTGEQQPAPSAKPTYTIVDQLGRTVEIPKKVDRIVALQHHTLDIMLELHAQDKLVGVLRDWESLLGSYAADVYPGIRNLETPGSISELNVEAVASLKPDVVFVSNQIPKETLAQLEQLGIPVVGITLYVADKEQASTINPSLVNPDEAYTEGLKQAIDLIGQITGTENKAAELWNYVVSNRAIVSEHLSAVPEQDRIKVYMANENMYTYGTGKYVGVAMAKAGARNVAETIKGYKQVSVEQVTAWNPEVIFVQSRYASVLDEIRGDKAWAAIDAVKNGKLIIAPDYTKPWGNPTPESMALGEIWLAKTLYPDAFKDVDLNAMVQHFYQTFYGIDYKE